MYKLDVCITNIFSQPVTGLIFIIVWFEELIFSILRKSNLLIFFFFYTLWLWGPLKNFFAKFEVTKISFKSIAVLPVTLGPVTSVELTL